MKSTGVAAIGVALTGCLGGNNSGSGDDTATDSSDETVNPEEPGWFDIDSNVFEEKMGQEVEITNSSLFRTSDNFGVQFTVANKGGAPIVDLAVHVNLLGANDEIIRGYNLSLTEAESIDDLATDERWSGDIVFEGTNPNAFFDEIVAYQIWATAAAERAGVGNETTTIEISENASNGTAGANQTPNETMTIDDATKDVTSSTNETSGNMTGES